MIIEELKSFLRATILISSDMTKKEFSLELLEKIIAMEQKLQASKDIYIEPPVPELWPGEVRKRQEWTPQFSPTGEVIYQDKDCKVKAAIPGVGLVDLSTDAP